MTQPKLVIGGYYSHHKKPDQYYQLIALGEDTYTCTPQVVYKCQYDNPKSNVWIRTKEEFTGQVKTDEGLVYRFKYLGRVHPDIQADFGGGPEDDATEIFEDHTKWLDDFISAWPEEHAKEVWLAWIKDVKEVGLTQEVANMTKRAYDEDKRENRKEAMFIALGDAMTEWDM